MAGEKIIERAPQTVDIGPDVGRARSGGLLRSDVIGRSQEHVGERDRCAAMARRLAGLRLGLSFGGGHKFG